MQPVLVSLKFLYRFRKFRVGFYCAECKLNIISHDWTFLLQRFVNIVYKYLYSCKYEQKWKCLHQNSYRCTDVIDLYFVDIQPNFPLFYLVLNVNIMRFSNIPLVVESYLRICKTLWNDPVKWVYEIKHKKLN